MQQNGKELYVCLTNEQRHAMNAAAYTEKQAMEVLSQRMKEIAQRPEAVTITNGMSQSERDEWLFNAALFTLCGFQHAQDIDVLSIQ